MKELIRFLQALLGRNTVYYIGGSDVLPPPLKGAEEQQALRDLEAGDENAKQLLIERNLRLVVFLARRFENTGVNLEDLISIGTIGLIKAISTYRLDRNIKLATYASRCIENEILMHIRKIAPLKAEVSLDEPINMDGDGNELLLSDVLGTDEDMILKPLEDDVDLRLLHQAVGALPEREREVLLLRYYRGMTQVQTARIVGVSQVQVSRLERRALGKLREVMS